MLERYFPSCEIVEVTRTTDVAEVVAAACANQRPVYAAGGATNLGLGMIAEVPGTVLSLGNLNQLVDYPSRDLTVTVEAGMTVGELARHLAANKQRLPIDVAAPDSATVGGVVAANVSGPRRFQFGTIRDYLLGLSAVDGTGKPFSTGGRVVKNAAGYDLTRLMIGTLGTLGVFTQVTLMVRPHPEMSALAAIRLPSPESADSLLNSLRTGGLEPAALELLTGNRLPESLSTGTDCTLWIGLESSEIEVRWMLDTTKTVCRKQGLEVNVFDEEKTVGALWRDLTEQAAIAPKDRTEDKLAVEVTVLPSKGTVAAARLRHLDAGVSLQCHAGNGVILAQFVCDPNRATGLAEQVRELATEFDGKAIVTSYPIGSSLDRQAIWGPPGPEMRVMQRIKQQFDPKDILSPGRFIFEPSAAKVAP